MSKVYAWFKNSATIFVARIGMVAAGALAGADQLAEIFNMPEVKTQLAAFLSAKTVAAIGLASFVIVELARRRSLKS